MLWDMAYTSTCRNCEKLFTRDRPGVYCSLACRGIAQTHRCNVEKVCEFCKSPFLVAKSQDIKCNAKYCSRQCYESGRSRIPVEVRFWDYVSRRGDNECWIWIGCLSTAGYGKIGIGEGKTVGAHRIAYEISNGPIPIGKQINHTCDVRACVNPAHLYAGTAKDNTKDCMDRGRWRSPFVHS